jgi:hypothetical protein
MPDELNVRQTGTSRSYIIGRLKRENLLDAVAAIESGKVSAYAVACELGWVRRRRPLGTGSPNAAKRRRHKLMTLLRGMTSATAPDKGLNAADGDPPVADGDLSLDDAVAAQELWIGPPAGGSQFPDRAALEAAWMRLRSFVMAEYARLGRRPMGWWEFEAPSLGLKYPADEREQSYLFEANILPENERADLLAHWKVEFGRGYLSDAKSRREHFRDADIPRSLIKMWTTERQRRTKTIRRLVA